MQFELAVLKANLQICNYLENSLFSSDYEEKLKGAGGDISLGIDLIAEKIFVKNLQEFGQIYSEESGYIGRGDDLIIIDPIDGSDNFLTNFPYFGSSVARIKNNKTINAIICNFVNGDIFIKNEKTFMKDNLKKSNKQIIKNNKDSKFGIFEKSYSQENIIKDLKTIGLKFRTPGAIALSLAYAHEVEFVLFAGKPRQFDVEAGWFMTQDLFRSKNDKFLLVSKSKEIFDTILKFTSRQII